MARVALAAVDVEIDRLASGQYWVISYAQLTALGLSRNAIDHRVAEGRLRRVYRAVYSVGRPELRPVGLARAAMLAVGADAILSHRTAGAIFRIIPEWPAEPDVLTARRSARGHVGMRLHRTRDLPAAHITRRERLPITTVERTLLDLAGVLTPEELTRALGEAEYLRILNRPRFTKLLAEARGRKGLTVLKELFDPDAPTATHSELEDRFLALVRAAGLPKPTINRRSNGLKVDFVWHEQRVIVETDGWAAHGTPRGIDRDHIRDVRNQLAGYRVMRVSWRQLVKRPYQVIANLAALLAA